MFTDYTLWNGEVIKVKIEGKRVTFPWDHSAIMDSLVLGVDYNGDEDTYYELEPIANTIDELINFSHHLDYDDKPVSDNL